MSPKAAPHPCSHPGCRALVHERYCPQHRRQQWSEQNARRRSTLQGKAAQSLYWSRSWRTFRRTYLMAHPLCIECKAEGRVEPAAEVDHIVAIARGGDTWSESNLQGLCKRHHSAKTLRESVRHG